MFSHTMCGQGLSFLPYATFLSIEGNNGLNNMPSNKLLTSYHEVTVQNTLFVKKSSELLYGSTT